MRVKEAQQLNPESIKLLEKLREQSVDALKKDGAFVTETGRLHVTDAQIENARREMEWQAKATPNERAYHENSEYIEGARLLDPEIKVICKYAGEKRRDRTIVVTKREVLRALEPFLSPFSNTIYNTNREK